MNKALLIVVSVLLLLSSEGYAQQTDADFQRLVYRNENSFGFQFHTLGWGGQFRRLYSKDGFKRHGYLMEWVTMKHPKEVKVYHPFYENARGYVFGKQNGLSTFRLGYGGEKLVVGKTDRGSVGINIVGYGGLSLGILKPVYLEIIRQVEGQDSYYRSTEQYDPAEHFVDNIFGRAPFFNGIDELKLNPGAFAKLGVNFEYGIIEEKITMIEVGVALDFFPMQPQIMAANSNPSLFATLYISMNFGKRWN